MAGEAAPAEAAAAAAPQAVAQMEAAAAATVEAGEAAPAGAAGEGSLERFVQGALPHEHAGALKELLRRHGVAFARVDKPQRRTFFYVSFRSRDDLVRGDAALRAIPGRSLRTKPARGKRPREASVDAQRPPKRAAPPASAEGEGEGGAGEAEGGEAEAKGGDAAEADGDDPSGDAAPRGDKPPRTLADATTPLWRLSYEEQLKKKQRAAENILRRIGRTVRSQFAPEAEMVTGSAGMVCPLERVVPSPEVRGYRNKSEFSIGLDTQRRPTVGFLLGRFAEGFRAVEAPDELLQVSETDKSLAALVTEYVRASPLTCWDRDTHTGAWRTLLVRTSWHSRAIMLVLQINPASLSPEQLAELRSSFVAHVLRGTNDDGEWTRRFAPARVASIQLQQHAGVSNAAGEDAPTEVLWGAESIEMQLLGLRFRLSARAFFQVNEPAAAMLYSLAGQWAQCGPDTVLLDVCCGTGTIGITLAHGVRRVVGLELVPEAVEDARANARLNGLDNCFYVAGKAEDTLPAAMEEHAPEASGAQVVAIVDPPRAGLHTNVLRALRNTRRLRRVVYISCNPASMAENVERLMKPPSNNFRHAPYACKRAAVVDLFPHTEHMEMVVLLER